jgi:prophage tail gpP-like protein
MAFRITVDGKNVTHFTSGSITLKLDSIASTFEFSSRFSAQDKEYQEMFKPLQYKDVQIFNSKDKLIFTGTILNHRFKSNKGRELVIISGYSKCGILEDISIPVSAYPLESTNRSLKDIADRLCGLFGINVVISEQGKTITDTVINGKTKQKVNSRTVFEDLKAKVKSVFGRTSASPSESIKDYLAKLASQKNIVLSHNEKGEVLFFQPDLLQKPRYLFTKGNSLEMSADFNGQSMHSDVNIVRQPSDENAGVSTSDTAKNSLIGKYRPATKVLTSGEDTDTKDAAKNEVASELKGIQISVKLQGLFDEIYPGEICNVHNHYIYSYAYNRFMVDSITMNFDESEDTTTLGLVVPESFTGGALIRNILYNHNDEDGHLELHLNEYNSLYTNDESIL